MKPRRQLCVRVCVCVCACVLFTVRVCACVLFTVRVCVLCRVRVCARTHLCLCMKKTNFSGIENALRFRVGFLTCNKGVRTDRRVNQTQCPEKSHSHRWKETEKYRIAFCSAECTVGWSGCAGSVACIAKNCCVDSIRTYMIFHSPRASARAQC